VAARKFLLPTVSRFGVAGVTGATSLAALLLGVAYVALGHPDPGLRTWAAATWALCAGAALAIAVGAGRREG
jgi:hypothetical protein